MSLSKLTATKIVEAVKNDKVATARIDSFLQYIPGLMVPGIRGMRGTIRNLGMALGEGLLDLGAQHAEVRFDVALGNNWNPFDPNLPGSAGYELQCTGIAEAASSAIMAAISGIPAVKLAEPRPRSTSFSHSGVYVLTIDESEYVFDWWVTLDTDNPYIFRYKDWDENRSGQAEEFKGFSGFHS